MCRLITCPTSAGDEVTQVVVDNGSDMCKTEFAGDDAFNKPKVPGIMVGMEQKDSNVGDDVQSKRGVSTVKHHIQHADNGSGICLAGFAEDAPCALLPSIVGGDNMPGQRHHFSPVSLPLLFGFSGTLGRSFPFPYDAFRFVVGWPKMSGIMDEKDSYVRDEGEIEKDGSDVYTPEYAGDDVFLLLSVV